MLLIKDKWRVLFIREVRHKGTNIGGEKRGGYMGSGKWYREGD